jgi:hypothetical protein
VERGLNKIEGKHARTSAATDAPNGGGPHDGTGAGAAPVCAPRASAAAPRTDPSAGKARGDAPDTNGYPGTGTANAAGGAVGGPGPGSDQRTDAQFPAPAPPGDRLIAAEGQTFQHDKGVESRPAPGDAGKQTRPITNLPLSGETAGQVQSSASGTEV